MGLYIASQKKCRITEFGWEECFNTGITYKLYKEPKQQYKNNSTEQ